MRRIQDAPYGIRLTALNDRDHGISDPVSEALQSYDITPMPWSRRDEFRDQLAA